MKTYPTRLAFFETWKSIRPLLAPLCEALEEANKADHDSKPDWKSNWANQYSDNPYGFILKSIRIIVSDYYEIPTPEVWSWEGGDSARSELKEWLVNKLVFKYNVYQEEDVAALKSAISNLGLEYIGRGGKATAQTLIHFAIETLCDGSSEEEAERAFSEEVLAAKERLNSEVALMNSHYETKQD
jgi:hypothetical protein